MQVTSGVRLGPYEVIDRLGAGGMGEVWRARDTRLERGVALKVLPPGFAGNEQLRLRLEREARSISQLSHPNICALFDVGRHEDVDYLVMELLDGESLAERLRRGPLPIAEVLRIGAQIADALAAAHGKGLVHRDLKPANIMLAKSGAKLLDFGLAREWVPTATGDGGEDGSTSIELTHKKALTGEGMIVGTYQYMAPEQLEGVPADARTDLFAFGAVLYEMATGKRAFDGKTRTSVIAAIIDRDPPPISASQPLTPPALEHVVRRCLAKNPEERWQSARDVGAEIRWIAGSSSEAQPMARRRRTLLPIAVLLIVAAVAAAAASRYFRREPEWPRITSSILAPAGHSFAFDNGSMVLSADGTKLLYVGRAGKEAPRICIRDMGTGEIRWLAGTEDALFPFWSPDGSRVGFFASTKLKTMAIAGGPAEVLAEAPRPMSGTWGADGTILFVANRNLMRIPASGSSEARMVREDTGGFYANHPFLLPGGQRFLYRRQNAISNDPRSGLYLASLDSDEERRLMRSDSNAVYLPGWILHWDKGRLRAVGFDISKSQLTGESFTVAADVQFNPGSGAAHFSVSQNGRLVYRGGTTIFNSRLTWLGRDGKELGVVGAADNYYGPRLSPDGRWAVVDISDAENNGDLWLLGIERPLKTRVSSHPSDESAAIWSRDGKELYYFRANPAGGTSIYRRSVSGGTAEELVLGSESANFPMDISPDGALLIYERQRPRRDLFIVGLPKGQPRPLFATEAQTLNGNFSPDGRHVLYVSDESGENEVYVRPLSSASAEKWQVSVGGGSQPRWRRDGRELFYVRRDGMFMSVPVAPGETFAPQIPQPLFSVVIKWNPSIAYDVAPDGKRFLFNVVVEEASATSITFVQNWLSNRTPSS